MDTTQHKLVNGKQVPLTKEELAQRELDEQEHQEILKTLYRSQRREEYLSVGDQLDAIYKGLNAIKNKVDLPQETKDWINHITDVKNKYRKPDADN